MCSGELGREVCAAEEGKQVVLRCSVGSCAAVRGGKMYCGR